MSLFLCFVRAPFKLALLNWMPLDKYWLEKKKNDQKSHEKYIKEIPSESANHDIFLGVIFTGIPLRLEKVNPIFSSFNSYPSFSSVATDDRK